MRGQTSAVGEERTAPNGYHYTKTKEGWRLTHHLIAERMLERALKSNERVTFKDGDRANLSEDNLVVRETKNSKEDRIKYLKSKIASLENELRDLES